MFDSFLTFSYKATILWNSARWVVGLLRFNLKHLKQGGWSTYTKSFSSYICPILDYCAGVWGFLHYDLCGYGMISKVQLYLNTDVILLTDIS